MEGLGGFVSLEGTGKAESSALSAQFSKQNFGVWISIKCYPGMWGHPTGFGIRG